jgi:hypothetical protein
MQQRCGDKIVIVLHNNLYDLHNYFFWLNDFNLCDYHFESAKIKHYNKIFIIKQK